MNLFGGYRSVTEKYGKRFTTPMVKPQHRSQREKFVAIEEFIAII